MSGSEEYAKQLSKQASAQYALGLGFKDSDADVLLCLADVMERYVMMLGAMSVERAEQGGRATIGSLDMLHSLSAVSRDGSRREDTVRDLRDFIRLDPDNNSTKWNLPSYHKKVPQFPVKQPSQANKNTDDAPKASYIPEHLPSFPPPHTYRKALGGSKRSSTGDITSSKSMSSSHANNSNYNNNSSNNSSSHNGGKDDEMMQSMMAGKDIKAAIDGISDAALPK